MARPPKIGLDYFPHDVVMDDKIELMEYETGLIGYAIMIKLWEKIYANGYFLSWSEDAELLFCKKNNIEKSVMDHSLEIFMKRGIFNETLFKKQKILTSRGIQKRYISVCKDAKRKKPEIVKEYRLVNGEYSEFIDEILLVNTEETIVNSEEIQVNTGETGVNSSLPQKEVHKEKKSKEEEKKLIYGEFENVFLTLEEYDKLTLKFNGTLSDKIEKLSTYMESKGIKYKSHYATILNWSRKEPDKPIDNNSTDTRKRKPGSTNCYEN